MCNRSRRGRKPNDSRHTLLCIEKASPPLGANRTTILSIGGLSWSAIPRAIRLCKADLDCETLSARDNPRWIKTSEERLPLRQYDVGRNWLSSM